MTLTAPLAFAQFRGSIQGTVTDPQGAVISGALLTLTDLSTNHQWTAKSNGEGIYYLEALPADTFNLQVSAPNFSSKTLTGVTIIPEQPNTINVQLALGAASATVTVNAGTVPALDTTTANISGTITSDQIQHMPSFNRDVFQLASLAPGMFGDNAQASSGNENNLPAEQNGGIQASQGIFTKGELTPQVEGNGGENNTSEYVIDGIPTASASWAGSTVIIPQEDSVQNLKVTANDYDAEFGRFSGAVIQLTSNTGRPLPVRRQLPAVWPKISSVTTSSAAAWAGLSSTTSSSPSLLTRRCATARPPRVQGCLRPPTLTVQLRREASPQSSSRCLATHPL
jgi:hypothetical protein